MCAGYGLALLVLEDLAAAPTLHTFMPAQPGQDLSTGMDRVAAIKGLLRAFAGPAQSSRRGLVGPKESSVCCCSWHGADGSLPEQSLQLIWQPHQQQQQQQQQQ